MEGGRPVTNEEIDERIRIMGEGCSNDEEIDGLTKIIRGLQEERAQEGVKIVFNPEAFETAMNALNELTGYRVELTLTTGEKHDAMLQGINRARDQLMWRDYETLSTSELQTVPWEQVVSVFVY
jgi:hypothetical protein